MWIPPYVSNFTMFSNSLTIRILSSLAVVTLVAACGEGPLAEDSESAVIDPPQQCSPGRPDCSVASDYPDGDDLTTDNSGGLRYSSLAGSLVIDRVTALPDSDGDGVPDDADDCPGTPDWISCDNDPSNDGIYQTLFYDPTRPDETVRTAQTPTTVDIPRIDVYFLIDATPTLEEEIAVLQAEILNIISDVRAQFEDAQFGLGLYREYPLFPLATTFSQTPYHHVLDLTDDETLVETAISTLNTVSNNTAASAATQALYSIASGRGLGRWVPNRGSCPGAPEADVGFPCFRDGALHVVMNISDSQVYNGPDPAGAMYTDPPFAPGVGDAVTSLPPVQMFPELFTADSVATALDLGDISDTSLTLMGMSTLLTDQVTTSTLPGCVSPPEDGGPPGADMDGKDVVVGFRLEAPVLGATASARNTHWPGANLALFDNPLLDPSLDCGNGPAGANNWGSVAWGPVTSQQYYLVADGIIPAADPGHMPEGAFSVSIVHDGDPENPAWLTSDAPALWGDVETALLNSHIRVASVVTLRDAATTTSDANSDARLMADATDALTKAGGEWVTELSSTSGEGLDAAISNTINLAKTDSVYNITMDALDNQGTGFDEREFIEYLSDGYCALDMPLGCDFGADDACQRCDIGAQISFSTIFSNTSRAPEIDSQVFDFEILVQADYVVDVERVPVRVLVPSVDGHRFDDTSQANFYRNAYDTTARCGNLEAPKWGLLTWDGSTPVGTSIDFEIRTANLIEDLATAPPAIVTVDSGTTSNSFDITDTLIGNDQPWGLPYLQITAVLNPSTSPPATPELTGWSFEFFCEAAQ